MSVMQNMSLAELVRAAEWSADFERVQAARREIVRRALRGELYEDEDEAAAESENDGYTRGMQDGYAKGFEDARKRYAL